MDSYKTTGKLTCRKLWYEYAIGNVRLLSAPDLSDAIELARSHRVNHIVIPEYKEEVYLAKEAILAKHRNTKISVEQSDYVDDLRDVDTHIADLEVGWSQYTIDLVDSICKTIPNHMSKLIFLTVNRYPSMTSRFGSKGLWPMKGRKEYYVTRRTKLDAVKYEFEQVIYANNCRPNKITDATFAYVGKHSLRKYSKGPNMFHLGYNVERIHS